MAQSKATGSVVKPGHYNGSPLAGIQLDFGVDCSAKLAADGGVDVIIKAIMNEGLTRGCEGCQNWQNSSEY